MPAAFSPCAEAGILPDYKEFGKEKHDSRRAGEEKKKKVNRTDKKKSDDPLEPIRNCPEKVLPV